MVKLEKKLQKIYSDPQHPSSLGGVDKLHRAFPNTPLKKIKAFLRTQDAYTQHFPIRKKFDTLKVKVSGKDQIWGLDLCEVGNLHKYNDGVKYLLFAIDLFSKFLFIRPLTSKTSTKVTEAFYDIITKSKRAPGSVWTDRGTEWVSQSFKDQLAKLGIKLYHTASNLKVTVVERCIRTLRSRMYRYFTAKKTYRYINVLQKFVKGYNASFHRSIKMAPRDVNLSNEKNVRYTLYPEKRTPFKKPTLQVGSYVRIAGLKQVFTKEAYQTFSNEVFKIIKVHTKNEPTTYSLEDLNGAGIEGRFYKEELVEIIYNKNTYHDVEKILKTITKKGKKYYLVKWTGYPNSFNSLVKASDLKKIK